MEKNKLPKEIPASQIDKGTIDDREVFLGDAGSITLTTLRRLSGTDSIEKEDFSQTPSPSDRKYRQLFETQTRLIRKGERGYDSYKDFLDKKGKWNK